MTEANNARKEVDGSRRTGIVLGTALGLAVAQLVVQRLGGYALYLPHYILAPITLFVAIGAVVGWLGMAPSLRLPPLLMLASLIVASPALAGVIEVRLRPAPFAIPETATSVDWMHYPWGERVLIFEDPAEVEALYDKLVASAEEDGWWCRSCRYQASTNTGHADFTPSTLRADAPRGYMGIEVWPGERAFYGLAPSAMTQTRVFHDQPTKSPLHVVIACGSLLAVAILWHVVARRRSA